MIDNFKSFNENLLFSKINESILYLSPKLRDKLNSINDNEISSAILSIEGNNVSSDITFLDIDKEGYLSFITMDNASKIIDKQFNNRLQLDTKYDQEASNYIWQRDMTNNPDTQIGVYRKSRNSIKIGKFVSKLFNGKYDPTEIEKFVNLFKSSKIDQEIKIVSGEDIYYWYNEKNYKVVKGSTLDQSCMKSFRNGIFDIYAMNPESCRLVIMIEDGKLIARALVWKLNSAKSSDGKSIPNIKYFMDRIYYTEPYMQYSLEKYAEENGWAYKLHDNNNRYDYYKGVSYKQSKFEINMSVKIKPMEYNNYPYLDTFARYDYKSGLLFNDVSEDYGGYILRNLSGGRRSIKYPSLMKRFVSRFKDFVKNTN